MLLVFPRKARKRAKRDIATAEARRDAACGEYIRAYEKRERPVTLMDWDIPTLESLLALVKRGRADTVKEALNALETDRYRERVEGKLNGQIELQQKALSNQRFIKAEIAGTAVAIGLTKAVIGTWE